jgi:hypothetical protein
LKHSKVSFEYTDAIHTSYRDYYYSIEIAIFLEYLYIGL